MSAELAVMIRQFLEAVGLLAILIGVWEISRINTNVKSIMGETENIRKNHLPHIYEKLDEQNERLSRIEGQLADA